jgi:hypothetical protein
LDSPTNRNDSDASWFWDVISEHDSRNIGRHTNLTEQNLIVKLDVGRAIADLPTDLRRICLLLVVLDRSDHVATVSGVSRATLHRRMRTIRAAFVEAGLCDYVRRTPAKRAQERPQTDPKAAQLTHNLPSMRD